MCHHIYVIKSTVRRQYFVGLSKNTGLKIRNHNQGRIAATRELRPWRLIYIEDFQDEELAQDRYLFLKTMRGEKFIRNFLHPDSELMFSPENVGKEQPGLLLSPSL